jgi:hypothetical protein
MISHDNKLRISSRFHRCIQLKKDELDVTYPDDIVSEGWRYCCLSIGAGNDPSDTVLETGSVIR